MSPFFMTQVFRWDHLKAEAGADCLRPCIPGTQQYIVRAHHRPSHFIVYRSALVLSNYVLLNIICPVSLHTLVANGFCSPPGWRLQPTRGSHTLVSPPLMSSRHRIMEPYGRWHTTKYLFFSIECKYRTDFIP